MQNKIQEILKSQNLTQAKFAERLGIQASAVSHLLSGRNGASFDVIQRILTAFPEINPDWLILEKGEMYRNEVEQPINQNVTVKTNKIEPLQRSLFDDELSNDPEYSTQKQLTPEENRSQNSPVVPSANGSPKNVVTTNNVNLQTMGMVTPNNTPADVQPQLQQQVVNSQPIQQVQPAQPIQQQVQPNVQQIVVTQAQPPRSIKKIIILYSDNTFEEINK